MKLSTSYEGFRAPHDPLTTLLSVRFYSRSVTALEKFLPLTLRKIGCNVANNESTMKEMV